MADACRLRPSSVASRRRILVRPVSPKRLDIVADQAAGLGADFDENVRKTRRATALPDPARRCRRRGRGRGRRRAFAKTVGKDVEQRLAHAVGGRPDMMRARRCQRPAAKLTADDPHRARPACSRAVLAARTRAGRLRPATIRLSSAHGQGRGPVPASLPCRRRQPWRRLPCRAAGRGRHPHIWRNVCGRARPAPCGRDGCRPAPACHATVSLVERRCSASAWLSRRHFGFLIRPPSPTPQRLLRGRPRAHLVRAMAKITKLEIADLGVTDSLFKGMAQSRLRYRLSRIKN